MRSAIWFALACVAARAAVDGVILNGTTGKPQAGVNVLLVQPSEKGMEPLGVAKSDAAGAFRVDKDPAANGPTLVQATYQGVTYTAVLAPKQPRTGVQVRVYEANANRAKVAVDRHGILFQPGEGKVLVQEFVFIDNSGNTTFNDAVNGTYQFFVDGDPTLDIQITAPGSMPVKRTAEKTGAPGTYRLKFPMRPGQTQIELSYETAKSEPLQASGKVLHTDGEIRLIVPRGFKLEGAGLEAFQPEPRTQSPIYGVKPGPYRVTISGKAAAAASEPEEDPGMNEIKASRPRIYDRFYPVLGLLLATLAAGMWLVSLNRKKEAPAPPPAKKKK